MRYIFVVLLALVGCQTPYQPNGFGGGYEDVRLSEDVFEIRARGNGYSSEGHTRNIVLLRASELARQNGFTHFHIVNSSMRTSQRQFTTPGYANTTAQANVYGNSASTIYGNNVSTVYRGTAYGTAHTTYMPPQTHTIENQHASFMVQMLRGPAPGALDAELIYAQLYPKLAG